jgi:4-amino-4-deoxy-L-arabinose transferase-like glycosyltransferase
LIIKEYFDNFTSLLITALVALSPMVIIYTRKILTEIPFAFLSLICIYFFYIYFKEKNVLYGIFAYIFLLFAVFTKLSGLFLILSLLVYFIIKKHYKHIFFIIVVTAVFVLFLYSINYAPFFPTEHTSFNVFKFEDIQQIYDLPDFLSKDFSYNHPILFFFFVHIILGIQNLVNYFIGPIPKNLVPISHYFFNVIKINSSFVSIFYSLLRGLFSLIAFIGFYCCMGKIIIKKISLFEVYVFVFSLCILTAHRITGNGRYMLPVLLFFIIYFVIGLSALFNYLVNKGLFSYNIKKKILVFLLFFLLFGSFLGALGLAYTNHNRTYPENWQSFLEVSEWVLENTNDEGIIITYWDHKMYLATGRKVIGIWELDQVEDSSHYYLVFFEDKEEDQAVIEYLVQRNFNINLLFNESDINVYYVNGGSENV